MVFGDTPAENEKARKAQRVAFFGGSFDPPHLGHLAVARAARTSLHLDTVLFAPVGAQPLKPQGSSASFEQRVAMTQLAIAGDLAFEISLADAPQPNGAPNYSWQTLSHLRAELPAGSQLFFLMGADSFAGIRRWFRAEELPFLAPLIVASRPGERLDDLCALLPDGLSLEPAPAPQNNDSNLRESLPNPVILSGAERSRRICYGLFSESSGNQSTQPASPPPQLHEFLLRNRSGATAPFYLLPDLAIEISATRIREQLRHESPHNAQNLLPAAVIEFIRAQKLYQ